MQDFNYDIFIKKLNNMFTEGKYDEVVEESYNIPPEEINDYIINLRALAMTHSENHFNFAEVYKMLANKKDEQNISAGWNYRMGLAFQRANRYASAIKYFEKELEIDEKCELKDVITDYILVLNSLIDMTDPGISFHQRAKNFWENFIYSKKDFDELIQSENQKDANAFLEGFSFLLRMNSIETSMQLGTGKIAGKYHIIFPLDDDITKYIMLKHLLSLMPEEIGENYLFSLGAISHFEFAFQLEDSLLSHANVKMAFFQVNKKVDIYFKNDFLESLHKKNPDDANNVAKVLAKNFLGEVFCLKNVSDIKVYDGEDLDFYNINLAVDYLRKLYDDVTYKNYPFDDYSYYRLQPDEDANKLREFAKNTITCVNPIFYDFLYKKNEIFDKNFDQGIVYLSLICNTTRFALDQALGIKKQLEDNLKLHKSNAYELIGSAILDNFIFIDLVVFDMEYFRSDLVWDYFDEPARKLGIKIARLGAYRYGTDNFVLFDKNEDERVKSIYSSSQELSILTENEIKAAEEFSYTPEDKQKTLDFIDKEIGKRGKVYYENYENDLSLEIHVVSPTKEKNYYTLVTVGMGTFSMEIPKEDTEKNISRCELLICLPSNWDKKMDDTSNYSWAIRWLRLIAHLPKDDNTWLTSFHTVESESPIADTNDYKGYLLTLPAFVTVKPYFKLSNGDDLNFYQIVPLYADEIEFKLIMGAQALFNRMEEKKEFLEVFIFTEDRLCVIEPDEISDEFNDENSDEFTDNLE